MNTGIITLENDRVHIPSSGEVWMTQHQIADLFGCFVAKVSANVRSILKSGVLDETRTCRMQRYNNGNLAEQYNLEMITALSFRIKSRNSELFREFVMKRAVAGTDTRQIILVENGFRSAILN